MKLRGLSKLLEGRSPEEQEALRQDIKDAFKDATPDNLPGKPVRPLPDGTRGGDLSGKLVQIVECPACECSFMLEAKS